MKKIFLAALIALCGTSFSFAQSVAECEEKCGQDYIDAKSQEECILQKCAIGKTTADIKEPEATSLVFKPLRELDAASTLHATEK